MVKSNDINSWVLHHSLVSTDNKSQYLNIFYSLRLINFDIIFHSHKILDNQNDLISNINLHTGLNPKEDYPYKKGKNCDKNQNMISI